MTKKLTILIATFAALGIVFAGVNGYACGSKCNKTGKTAANVEKCDPANCAHAASNASCATKCASHAGAQKAVNENGGTGEAAAAAMGIVTADAKTAQTATSSGCSSTKTASKSSCATTCSSSKATKAADQGANSSSAKDWAAVCASKGYYAANVYEVRDGHQYAVCNGTTFEVTDKTPFNQVGQARYYFADEASQISCNVKMAEMASKIDREAVALATAEGNVRNADNGLKFAQCLESGKEFAVTADTPVKVMDGKKYYAASMSAEKAAR